jgi:hypothetical protein
VELGQPGPDRVLDDLALVSGLVGATGSDAAQPPEVEGTAPSGFEAGVGVIDVRLLRLEVGMCDQDVSS